VVEPPPQGGVDSTNSSRRTSTNSSRRSSTNSSRRSSTNSSRRSWLDQLLKEELVESSYDGAIARCCSSEPYQDSSVSCERRRLSRLPGPPGHARHESPGARVMVQSLADHPSLTEIAPCSLSTRPRRVARLDGLVSYPGARGGWRGVTPSRPPSPRYELRRGCGLQRGAARYDSVGWVAEYSVNTARRAVNTARPIRRSRIGAPSRQYGLDTPRPIRRFC
jgi:hypothetical protein